MSQVEHNKWYRLYNKERKRYLSAQVFNSDDNRWSYTAFCHSEKAKATCFMFEPKDKMSGSVDNGDRACVKAFSTSKDDLGYLCVPEKQHDGILLDISAEHTFPDQLWRCLFQIEVL